MDVLLVVGLMQCFDMAMRITRQLKLQLLMHALHTAEKSYTQYILKYIYAAKEYKASNTAASVKH